MGFLNQLLTGQSWACDSFWHCEMRQRNNALRLLWFNKIRKFSALRNKNGVSTAFLAVKVSDLSRHLSRVTVTALLVYWVQLLTVINIHFNLSESGGNRSRLGLLGMGTTYRLIFQLNSPTAEHLTVDNELTHSRTFDSW